MKAKPKVFTEESTLNFLRAKALEVKNGSIVEVGVAEGSSLGVILKSLSGSVFKPLVVGVDPWGAVEFKDKIYPGRAHMLKAYTSETEKIARAHLGSFHYENLQLMKMPSVMAAHLYEGPQIELLFIDANHTYDAVMEDFNAWAPHLSEGAVVVFDDYWPGRFDGVVKAVDELALTYGGSLVAEGSRAYTFTFNGVL